MAASLEHLWLGRLPYRDAWAVQRALAAARARGEVGDVVLLVEHPPVYTMGRNGSADHVPSGPDHLIALGADYLEVDRGGSITFHGPGQMVAYPILRIAGVFPLRADPQRGDVVAHLRALEEALIATVASCGVQATRRPPYTGIWVGEEKLAAIGVKLASGVTTHGAALNVSTDLKWFAEVIPCGIEGAGVASLESLGARPVPVVHDIAERFAVDLARAIGREPRDASDAVRRVVGEATQVPRLSDRAAPVGWVTSSYSADDLCSDDQILANKPPQTHKPLVNRVATPLPSRSRIAHPLGSFSTSFHPPSGRASRGIPRWQPSSATACSIS